MVQSIALTRRGSLVRVQQFPQKNGRFAAIFSYQLFSCQLMIDDNLSGDQLAVFGKALDDVDAVAQFIRVVVLKALAVHGVNSFDGHHWVFGLLFNARYDSIRTNVLPVNTAGATVYPSDDVLPKMESRTVFGSYSGIDGGTHGRVPYLVAIHVEADGGNGGTVTGHVNASMVNERESATVLKGVDTDVRTLVVFVTHR